MVSLESLKVRIFADGADKAGILDLYSKPYIKGLTTNPTLMRKAGIADYESFARDILETVTEKPVSFEVLADDFPEMKRQALKIAGWADNVFVKIPITNSQRESAVPLIRELVEEGVKVNVTAMLTVGQAESVARVLNPDLPAIVSIFAGRIADTGVDPMPVVEACLQTIRHLRQTELLWASIREVLNLVQAEQSGCQIVTATHDVLAKAARTLGADLDDLSLDTVRMFARDAREAGFEL